MGQYRTLKTVGDINEMTGASSNKFCGHPKRPFLKNVKLMATDGTAIYLKTAD